MIKQKHPLFLTPIHFKTTVPNLKYSYLGPEPCYKIKKLFKVLKTR